MRGIAHEPRAPRTAAEWFAARRAGQDPVREAGFRAWIAEDPRHAQAYALCELTFDLALPAAERVAQRTAPPPRWRRAVPWAGALAMAAGIVLTVLWLLPVTASVWRTAPGEQRIVELADGSRVTLNTRSVIEVRMGRTRRDLRLLAGEAFFEVAKDPARPFVVETPFGSARAVGTRFNVLIEPARVEVSTEEGRVLVQAPDSALPGVLASAGTRAILLAGGARPALDRADLTRIQNWRAHRLEFNRVPLEVALREFSRYTVVPIRAATPQIGQIAVSAVLRAGDVDALGATLKAAFGLHLVPGREEWLVAAR